jgi:hypothetical protein
MSKIYGLKYENTIYYVGLTDRSLQLRLQGLQHNIADSKNPGLAKWLIGLRDSGVSPEIVLLEETPVRRDWARETFWINKLQEEGQPLLNIVIEKLGKVVTAAYRKPKVIKHKQPAESQSVLSRAVTADWENEEHRATRVAGIKRAWDGNEQRKKKIGEVTAKNWHNPIYVLRVRFHLTKEQAEAYYAEFASTFPQFDAEQLAENFIAHARDIMDRSFIRRGNGTCIITANNTAYLMKRLLVEGDKAL